MAGARGRGGRAGGLARAVGRLVLLVGLGFGAGLVIGVVFEEPGLLVGHWRGEGESVPLAEGSLDPTGLPEPSLDEGPAAAPEAAAEASGEGAPDPAVQARRLALQRTVESLDAEAAPPVAAAARTSGQTPPEALEAVRASATATAPPVEPEPLAAAQDAWAIQVGAFSEEAAARRLESQLETKDYPVVVEASTSGTKSWRVRVQPVSGESRARELARRLKRDESLPTWLIRLETGSGR